MCWPNESRSKNRHINKAKGRPLRVLCAIVKDVRRVQTIGTECRQQGDIGLFMHGSNKCLGRVAPPPSPNL